MMAQSEQSQASTGQVAIDLEVKKPIPEKGPSISSTLRILPDKKIDLEQEPRPSGATSETPVLSATSTTPQIMIEGDDTDSCQSLQHCDKDSAEAPSSLQKESRHHNHDKIPSLLDVESSQRKESEVVLTPSGNSYLSLAELGCDQEENSFRSGHQWRGSTHSHLAATTVVHHEKKTKHDHSPHELFIELDELHSREDHQYEWKEKARWIKFEENVEEGADRWGKPHVSSLSFQSLLNLRKCIKQGIVLLDLEQDNLPSIVSLITEEMVKAKMLKPEDREKVLSILLQKHKHQDGRGFIRRHTTFFHNYSAREIERQELVESLKQMPSREKRSVSMPRSALTGSVTYTVNGEASQMAGHSTKTARMKTQEKKESISFISVTERKQNGNVKDSSITMNGSMNLALKGLQSTSIMKRIPDAAESTSVLVGSVEFLDKPIMAFVRLAKGLMLDNFTEVSLPVRFIIILMGPPSDKMDYHEIGRSISTLMSNMRFHNLAYMAETRNDLLTALNHFLDESVVLPPGKIDKDTLLPIISMANGLEQKEQHNKGEEECKQKVSQPEITISDTSLKRTGRPFGGLVNDIKKRYPMYWSDIKDAFNLQCLAVWLFIYFAALSPTITFGGLLGEKLDKWMGVSELLVSVFSCGIVFALISGQPLLILSCTGPVLVFEEGLYNFCKSASLEYISFRVWVGFWVTIITAIFIGCELIFLVRYITRFTEDVFAALISVIFITETIIKIIKQFEKHPLQEYYPPPQYPEDSEDPFTNVSSNANTSTAEGFSNWTTLPLETTTDAFIRNQPNTALLSMILTFGTFIIANVLKQFRNSHFFGKLARRSLGDFAIPIAVMIMVAFDIIIKDTYTEKLDVPDGLKPTDERLRSWVINPMGMSQSLPVWAFFAAAIPAIFLFILIFMQTQITSMIVNNKDRKLKKGAGYHLDIMIVGAFASTCGILGIPFLTGATVRTMSHISALSVYSKTEAPGEKPKLVGVKEQRVTALLVHATLGMTIFLSPVLRQIALAVLSGVFLYLGVAIMRSIQLFDRVLLMFIPVKHHPDVGYVRKVRTWKMHLFTVIQLLCLALLWAVKSTAAALAFPFVLLLMVPFRLKPLQYIFSKEELEQLDKK